MWKAYFDKGFGLLNYLKYILAIIGFGAVFNGVPIYTILAVGVGYAALCTVLGRYWYIRNLVDMEYEIGNMFNPFVNEMRDWREKFK